MLKKKAGYGVALLLVAWGTHREESAEFGVVVLELHLRWGVRGAFAEWADGSVRCGKGLPIEPLCRTKKTKDYNNSEVKVVTLINRNT